MLAEPAMRLARVFDLVGSEWVQRGRTLRGWGSFGAYVAVSTPPAAVINGVTTKIPVVLVVSRGPNSLSFDGLDYQMMGCRRSKSLTMIASTGWSLPPI